MKGMTLIVKTVARWLQVFIFLFGVYITVTGHLGPGGGFAGGVIVACGFMLLTLAYGKEAAPGKLGLGAAEVLDSSGALLFLAIALLGLGYGGTFFANFLQRRFPGTDFALLSAGTILINNIAIGLKVGASLFLIFVTLAILRIVAAKEEEEQQ